ncbi:MAG: hypothetical protein MR913_07245 [Clostridiales bacterium]|nr:hypothetical protein [Clostridiales bacterium]
MPIGVEGCFLIWGLLLFPAGGGQWSSQGAAGRLLVLGDGICCVGGTGGR